MLSKVVDIKKEKISSVWDIIRNGVERNSLIELSKKEKLSNSQGLPSGDTYTILSVYQLVYKNGRYEFNDDDFDYKPNSLMCLRIIK